MKAKDNLWELEKYCEELKVRVLKDINIKNEIKELLFKPINVSTGDMDEF